MIDWLNMFFNAAWIVACSIALAALSYASWDASNRKVRLRDRLAQPGYQLIFNLAGLLFSLGLAGTSDVLWETELWAVLAVLLLWQSAGSWKAWRKQRGKDDEKPGKMG